VLLSDLACSNNIQEIQVIKDLQIEHSSGQRRSFVDSSKVSLKAVLLHNTKKVSSVPLAHAVHIKETDENLQVWLQVHYEEHRWKICADLHLQQSRLSCKADTLNSAADNVNGTAERGTATAE
jgi:hypothetical protein